MRCPKCYYNKPILTETEENFDDEEFENILIECYKCPVCKYNWEEETIQ